MRSYKKWTPEFRKQSLKLTNKAKKMGWIPQPTKCKICHQTKGIIHLHNEDYDATYYTLKEVFDRFPIEITRAEMQKVNDALVQLCWRCHMMHHSKHRNPTAVEEYFLEVLNGKQYPPVFRHDFTILNRDHNV
tara:strand:+ start:3570 stop:3968 length:399 start_codon:yes stop_codon:yes gene_type:complete